MRIKPTIQFSSYAISFIDQSRLPTEIRKVTLTDYRKLIQAIKTLKIRGAPALGIAGAYGLVLAARHTLKDKNGETFIHQLLAIADRISAARPTAVNLSWAMERMKKKLVSVSHNRHRNIALSLREEADAILEEDIRIGQRIGEIGDKVIRSGDAILTHCNAGGLATGGMGSALAALFYAHRRGKRITVYVNETRPLLQGARLTTFELKKWKIPHRLICDNMAGDLMKKGKISKVITGADRIASNGDAANKIGTYGLAVLADYHKIPFYIAAPYSTFDPSLFSGEKIPIEIRDEKEITHWQGKAIAPRDTRAWNPAFDVVPAKLINGIITEEGILFHPHRPKIIKYLKKKDHLL